METETGNHSNLRGSRQRRAQITNDDVRFFLPKPGSLPATPELGMEIGSEGEALVQAFKDGGVFYVVVTWSATTEIDGSEPKIVKQALKR